MVEDTDPHDPCGFDEASGDSDIFVRGGGITRGVVMDKDNSGSGVADSITEHFTWVDRTGVQQTAGDLNRFTYDTIFDIEHDYPEDLLR